MESRNYSGSERERVKVSDKKVEEEKKAVKKSSQPETVQLMLARDMKLNYTGPITGKLYTFQGAGAVLPVDKEDAEIMVEKRGGACCEGSGSGQPSKYFVEL
jgi:hypothetical protein